MNLQINTQVFKKMISKGELTGHTSGMAKGYVQANVVYWLLPMHMIF